MGLFAVGLFYWSLNEFTNPVNSSNPYKTIFAITGDANSTVEILKCADLKSVATVTSNDNCCSDDLPIQTQKTCLEDWMTNEIKAHN